MSCRTSNDARGTENDETTYVVYLTQPGLLSAKRKRTCMTDEQLYIQTRVRARARTQTHRHTHARTHARTHTHTHTRTHACPPPPLYTQTLIKKRQIRTKERTKVFFS